MSDHPDQSDLLAAAPGLARLAAGAWLRAASWSVGTGLRASGQAVQMATDPALAARAVVDVGSALREYARDLLGITELDHRVRRLSAPAATPRANNGDVPEEVGLRLRGAQLLRAAAEVAPDGRAHPAYARILTELAPDEGRILRLLATDGAQPSVDVHASNLIGVSSQLTGAGLNMIGAQAGCADHERVRAYLNNLERLGLVSFSHEPLEDPIAYQVLEAQPEVMEAIKSAPRAKTIQRSIHLTAFGRDFCDVCLPLDSAEAQALASELDQTAD